MKYLLFLSMVLTTAIASGQKITGVVLDKSTGQAILGASIKLKGLSTQTLVTGLFELQVNGLNDTLHVTEVGYKPFAVFVTKDNLNLRIELEPNTINLNDVNITGTHSFKQDSLANRDEYAKQFNYTPPKLKDVIGLPNSYRPGQLLTVDVLTLVNYLTYKSSPEYKFKQVLVRDEHEQYVDEKFNRGLVSRITDLKGDTLLTFLSQYRPTYQFTLKATDYDMEVYVRDCYKKFATDEFKTDTTFSKNR